MVKKVLIVDDAPEIRNFLRELILEPLDFEVLDAGTVKEAWTLFQANLNDLAGILMDGELADGETTDQLVSKIRGVWQGPIIATASRRAPELIEAGCNAAVSKSGGRAAIEHAVMEWFR